MRKILQSIEGGGEIHGFFCSDMSDIEKDTVQRGLINELQEWQALQWARKSPAYPEGLLQVVHPNEVLVVSERTALVPIGISRRELDVLQNVFEASERIPKGHYTTDPGYHIFKEAVKDRISFDDRTGCWNAVLDLETIPAHQSVVHACGNPQCCNIRHLDIASQHKDFYRINPDNYIDFGDGRIAHKARGVLLPGFWESWNLYWSWLAAHSGNDFVDDPRIGTHDETDETLLNASDFGHIWVHPVTGCWENESFYPRWDKNGAQVSSYGYHRKHDKSYGRGAHRYLYFKYRESIGSPVYNRHRYEVDHVCINRRCCNPLHLQHMTKKSHRKQTGKHTDEVKKIVSRRIRMRRLGSAAVR